MQLTLTKEQAKMIKKMEEVQNKLEELIWQRGIEIFKITQTSKKFATKVVEVTGLEVEIEEEFIMFADLEDKVRDKKLVLMMFLVDSLKNVTITGDYTRLEFKAGEIVTIEVIR